MSRGTTSVLVPLLGIEVEVSSLGNDNDKVLSLGGEHEQKQLAV